MRFALLAPLLVVSSLPLVACSDDSDPDEPSADVIVPDDAASDAGDTPGDDTGEEPLPIDAEIRFELINANPGALSRWVEVRNTAGQPGWWNLNEDSIALVELRAHANCGITLCDAPGAPICGPQEVEILELAPGESVSGVWDLTLWEIDQGSMGVCRRNVPADAASYRVQFCWSPNPPVDGRLDPATISCTRLPFALGGDAVVSYAIEGLATCGNGTCDPGETSLTCADDCSGITPTDAVIACARHCTSGASCDAEFARDLCELQVCSALAETLDGATDDCIAAVRDQYACAASLECDAFATWTEGGATSCADADALRASECGE